MGNQKTMGNSSSKNPSERCEQNGLVGINTFCTPRNKEIPNLATWYINGGTQAKQLDYFLINMRYKNRVKRIPNRIIANTSNQMQHRAELHH